MSVTGNNHIHIGNVGVAAGSKTIRIGKKKIKALAATVKEQATLIQKVSAQLEVSKSAPQVVANNQ